MCAKWAGRSCPSCRGTSTSCRRTTGGVRCWNALASATETLRNSLTRAITLRAALGILAASKRYGVAVLTLQSRLSRSAVVPRSTVETLADELDASMRSIGHALRDDTELEALPRLRDAQVELKRAYDEMPDSSLAALVSETDLLVDSVETMAGVLHRLHTAAD